MCGKYWIAKFLLLSSVVYGSALVVFAAPSDSANLSQQNALAGFSAELTAAHRVVENTTADMLMLIGDAKQYINDDEARFYHELGELLHKYVDFDAFARGVMGKHVSPKRLATLSESERGALNQQIIRFTQIFANSLINTYGKGILVFEGERVEVVPPKLEAEARAKHGKALVKQLIFGESEQPFEIYYSLRTNADGDWKIRNMIVQSTNLGKIYRNQFDNAYQVHGGDIGKVIDNWISNDDKSSD